MSMIRPGCAAEFVVASAWTPRPSSTRLVRVRNSRREGSVSGSWRVMAGSHGLHVLRERRFLARHLMPVTDALDDAVSAIASSDLENALDRVGVTRVDGVLGAQATRDLEPKRLDVDDDGPRGAGTMAEDVEHTQ